MYDLFEERGIPVAITRTTDETLNPTERVERILAPFGSGRNVIVISNHINAGGGDGAEVIYALRNNSNLSNLILSNFEDAGQNVRDAFQRRLPSNTSKDYYFIHRNTGNTEPVIVEYGFLDSTLDDPNQLKNDYRELTEAVVNAVLEYIGESTPSGNTYIVKSGDSLWSIAKKYGVTVDELKSANNLTSNLLNVGQRLKIPSAVEEETTEYTNYTVKSGDTLYSIAKQYDLTMQELISFNNLSSTLLSIGQTLRIPVAVEETVEPYTIYTVKSGDNLYAIARNYGVSVADIMSYNNLTSNLLSIGQTLRIPTTSTTYTVQKGDTLYSIARKFDTTVDNIKQKNNLTSNTLSLGQKLII